MEEGVPTANHLAADDNDSEFEEAVEAAPNRCGKRRGRHSRQRRTGPEERRPPCCWTLQPCTILQACGAIFFSVLSLVCLLVATSDAPDEAVAELAMLLSAGTAGSYLVQANSIAAGSFKITVANVGSTASEAIVLSFVALKGASS